MEKGSRLRDRGSHIMVNLDFPSTIRDWKRTLESNRVAEAAWTWAEGLQPLIESDKEVCARLRSAWDGGEERPDYSAGRLNSKIKHL